MTYIPRPVPMHPKGRPAVKWDRRRSHTPWRKPVYWKAALQRRERAERQAAAKATRRATRGLAS